MPAPFICDVCGREYNQPQGLGVHKRKAHNIVGQLSHYVPKKAKVAARPKWVNNHEVERASDLFFVVGEATKVLFPDGVPMDRIIEVAEWQKATLKMMSR